MKKSSCDFKFKSKLLTQVKSNCQTWNRNLLYFSEYYFDKCTQEDRICRMLNEEQSSSQLKWLGILKELVRFFLSKTVDNCTGYIFSEKLGYISVNTLSKLIAKETN